MARIEITYDALSRVVDHSTDLSRKAENYANELTYKVRNKFGEIPGPSSGNVDNADYYVRKKIEKLNSKSNDYSAFSQKISTFEQIAKSADDAVSSRICSNRKKLFEEHKDLEVTGFFADMVKWLLNQDNILNKVPGFIEGIATTLETMKDDIMHWYSCEGGKRIVDLVIGVIQTVVAIAIVVAGIVALVTAGAAVTIPVAAVAVGILAVMAAVDGITNIATSVKALGAEYLGDPGWAEVYGDQNDLAEVLRQSNSNNPLLNGIANDTAFIVDMTKNVCNTVLLFKNGVKYLATDVGETVKSKGLIQAVTGFATDGKSLIQKTQDAFFGDYVETFEKNSNSNLSVMTYEGVTAIGSGVTYVFEMGGKATEGYLNYADENNLVLNHNFVNNVNQEITEIKKGVDDTVNMAKTAVDNFTNFLYHKGGSQTATAN